MKSVNIDLNFTNNTNETQTISFFNGGGQDDIGINLLSNYSYGSVLSRQNIDPDLAKGFAIDLNGITNGYYLLITIPDLDPQTYWENMVTAMNQHNLPVIFSTIIGDPFNYNTWVIIVSAKTQGLTIGDLTFASIP